jgi:hypothetical protein
MMVLEEGGGWGKGEKRYEVGGAMGIIGPNVYKGAVQLL